MEEEKICSICGNKIKIIKLLEEIKKIIKIKKNFTSRFANIVMEEVIDFYWNNKNKNSDTIHFNENIYNDKINKIIMILNYLTYTNFVTIKRTNKLYFHIVNSLEQVSSTMKTDQFQKKHIVKFFNNVFSYKPLTEDINFIIWVLSNNTRCKFVFSMQN